jgi:hypothetical protein
MRMTQEYHVTLYTGPMNEELEAAIDWLERRGIHFETKDIVGSNGARGELIHQTGRAVYPTINVDGRICEGFFEPKWEHLLKRPDPKQGAPDVPARKSHANH